MALLDNQIAVITGAAQGIGYAIATTLHEHGAHVVIADLDPDLAGSAAQKLTGESNGHAYATGARCDVTNEDLWIPCDRCRVAQAQVEVVTAAGPIFLCEHHHKDHHASIVAAGHLIRAWPPDGGPCS
jgi:NAD(P)-dependent dehydrogenase (short-subunit alcohol dehydrogenase family)